MAGHGSSKFPVSVVISALDHFSKPLQKMGGEVGKFGAHLKHLGHDWSLYVTAPLAAFAALSVHAAAEVDTSLNRFQARTRASGEEMAELREQVEKLGEAPSTVARAAEAADLLAKRGRSAHD